jgi:hypothetical protein
MDPFLFFILLNSETKTTRVDDHDKPEGITPHNFD